MQQTKVFEAQSQVRPAIDVRATIRCKIKSVNQWLDQKSKFYSHICGEEVTRRSVLHCNAAFIALGFSAIAIEQRPLLSVVGFMVTAYLVYLINTEEKEKGGKL
ncbi:MAG: Tat pathway signal protein [Prevotellaceae bacterium]|nr:Tat pathway signal protein [Prevotellaceae bacterium]MDY3365127.1 Tat pathway signal protein [Prevotella sp.]